MAQRSTKKLNKFLLIVELFVLYVAGISSLTESSEPDFRSDDFAEVAIELLLSLGNGAFGVVSIRYVFIPEFVWLYHQNAAVHQFQHAHIL